MPADDEPPFTLWCLFAAFLPAVPNNSLDPKLAAIFADYAEPPDLEDS